MWSESNSPATWTNWAAGEPDSLNGDEDCVAMANWLAHTWIDTPCDGESFHALCEA